MALREQLTGMRRIIAVAGIIMALFAPSSNAHAEDAVPAAGEMMKSIMVFGDSLTAGHGLPETQGYPAQLEARLRQDGINMRVIDAGVSGDTTAGGLRRLNYALKQQPDYVILELGANDMLRATDPAVTRENLKQMMEILKTYGRPVLIAGMRAFPNLGPTFEKAYPQMYKDLADEYHAGYYPFFLEGVAGIAALNQEDGVHPTKEGIAVIVEKTLPAVKQLLLQPTPTRAAK